MPFQFEKKKKKIPKLPGFDRRIKLTEEQKAEIRLNAEGLSQRGLAAKYKVSRRTVQFILSPEKLTRNLECRQARGGSSAYYHKEQHRLHMQRHRQHKRELDKKGVLE